MACGIDLLSLIHPLDWFAAQNLFWGTHLKIRIYQHGGRILSQGRPLLFCLSSPGWFPFKKWVLPLCLQVAVAVLTVWCLSPDGPLNKCLALAHPHFLDPNVKCQQINKSVAL